ncbi:hypothetical protein LSH36_1861g00001 [Paralvinella palmiformis]|uniref:Uncharacterized protein n=1 Tax=Paralvinella palmiformis TaxID=53620 RepID=A0AAD9IRI2_9ANNE|nr:hypothetical protein LSH36_1861g00001 [Paralvinella palmiformis]
MDSLNYSICSSTNAILSQYEECVQTVEVSQQVSLCYSPLAWNSSTCALVPKRNAPSDQCQYVGC